jgi:hypothetical protein
MALELPSCGLYRTGRPFSGRDGEVPAGRLVFFHNHSQQGEPLVVLPATNTHNRWRFHDRGFLVRGEGAEDFIKGLEPLAQEGYYLVTGEIVLGSGSDAVLKPRTLVQIGYTRAGEPILFAAKTEGNGFSFPATGHRFQGIEVFGKLKPAGFDAPGEPAEETTERVLH